MKKVIIESPFAGNTERNKEYARKCMRDSLLRGEAPLCSHLLYTQMGILDDNIKHERDLGIEAGLIWGEEAELTVVYEDYGISMGMLLGIERANNDGRPVEYRKIF
ncbi:MAG: hypothetical protein WCW87_01335 [Candidatus Paceibacterota bacterium]